MHWYDKEGNPQHWVTAKNGVKRGTTLRDARKHGWVPSVTSVMDILAKPGLDRWKTNKAIEASISLSRKDGETNESFTKRILSESKKESEKAAERGSRIHNLLDMFFKESSMPESMSDQRIIGAVFSILNINCGLPNTKEEMHVDWKSEHTFTSDQGYGGMVDLCSDKWVIDFKTKEFDYDYKNLAYDSMGYQLIAYAKGLGIESPRIANIFISVTHPGHAVFHEWPKEEHERLENIFTSTLSVWKDIKKYYPENHHEGS